MSRYEELLQQANEHHLTQEQVISALASLLDFNDAYVRRRANRGHHTEVDTFLMEVAPAVALAIELLQNVSEHTTDESGTNT